MSGPGLRWKWNNKSGKLPLFIEFTYLNIKSTPGLHSSQSPKSLRWKTAQWARGPFPRSWHWAFPHSTAVSVPSSDIWNDETIGDPWWQRHYPPVMAEGSQNGRESSCALKWRSAKWNGMESKHHDKSYTKKAFMTIHVKMRDAVWENTFPNRGESHSMAKPEGWVLFWRRKGPSWILCVAAGHSASDQRL